MIISGMCPSSLQNPYGKEIPVAVIGLAPYVLYNDNGEWKGGVEFEIIEIWGKAFGFTPKLLRVDSYDKEDPPGMVYSVGNIYSTFGF